MKENQWVSKNNGTKRKRMQEKLMVKTGDRENEKERRREERR